MARKIGVWALGTMLLGACGPSGVPPTSSSGGAPGVGGQSLAGGGSSNSNGGPAGGASGGAGTNGGGALGGGSGGGVAVGGALSGGGAPVGGDGAGGRAPAGGSGGPSGGSGGSAGGEATPCPYTPPALPDTIASSWTSGEVSVFNDDGAWTWFSDERVIVDAAGEKLMISSDANVGGRKGNVDVVIHDLKTHENEKSVLGTLEPDDHNTGAILVKGANEYVAFWAGHNQDCNSYWSNYAAGKWAPEQTFDWAKHTEPCPWGASTPRSVTYNNLWNMSSEGKYYNFTRAVDTNPNFLVSTDSGKTWKYGGSLTASPTVGFAAGYYKYWGNGVDRIDFLATEAHPRDRDNSLYHGYVQGGKVYDSSGKVIDNDITDASASDVTAYTQVFKTGTQLNGLTLNFLWNFDIVRYSDGTLGALWKARNNGVLGEDDPDHRMLYSRFDGASWKATYLVKGGKKLYNDEQDYIGGAALDPDDPNVIYISTPYDPRDESKAPGKHEIWKGVTCNKGTTFTWTPITMNSTKDNLRPVMPKWDAKNKALLWFRGTYVSAQSYTAEVVGIITRQ